MLCKMSFPFFRIPVCHAGMSGMSIALEEVTVHDRIFIVIMRPGEDLRTQCTRIP